REQRREQQEAGVTIERRGAAEDAAPEESVARVEPQCEDRQREEARFGVGDEQDERGREEREHGRACKPLTERAAPRPEREGRAAREESERGYERAGAVEGPSREPSDERAHEGKERPEGEAVAVIALFRDAAEPTDVPSIEGVAERDRLDVESARAQGEHDHPDRQRERG